MPDQRIRPDALLEAFRRGLIDVDRLTGALLVQLGEGSAVGQIVDEAQRRRDAYEAAVRVNRQPPSSPERERDVWEDGFRYGVVLEAELRARLAAKGLPAEDAELLVRLSQAERAELLAAMARLRADSLARETKAKL